jgi:hypothetical protein
MKKRTVMKRLTPHQKVSLQRLLIKRWVTVMEEDNKTDGFHENVAELLGVDVSELSTEVHEFTALVIKDATRWLQRLPGVQ